MSTVVLLHELLCFTKKRFGKKPQVYLSPSLHCRRGARKGKDSGKGDNSQLEFAKATRGPNSDPISQRLVCFVLFVRRSGHDASEVEAANLCGFVDLGRRDLGSG